MEVVWSPRAGALRQRRLAYGGEAVGEAAARPVAEGVVAGPPSLVALAPVAGEVAVDDALVDGAQVLVGEPAPLQAGITGAGDEDVGLLDGLEESVAAPLVADVDGGAALVAVGLLPKRPRLAVAPGVGDDVQRARGVAAAGVLDLEHVGAPLRQDGRPAGHCGHRPQLDHLDAAQGSCHLTVPLFRRLRATGAA